MTDIENLLADIRAARELHRYATDTIFRLMERLAVELQDHQHRYLSMAVLGGQPQYGLTDPPTSGQP